MKNQFKKALVGVSVVVVSAGVSFGAFAGWDLYQDKKLQDTQTSLASQTKNVLLAMPEVPSEPLEPTPEPVSTPIDTEDIKKPIDTTEIDLDEDHPDEPADPNDGEKQAELEKVKSSLGSEFVATVVNEDKLTLDEKLNFYLRFFGLPKEQRTIMNPNALNLVDDKAVVTYATWLGSTGEGSQETAFVLVKQDNAWKIDAALSVS